MPAQTTERHGRIFPMTPSGRTPGGANVYSPTAEEFEAWLEEQSIRTVGLDLALFAEALDADILDRGDADVAEMEMLLRSSRASGAHAQVDAGVGGSAPQRQC